MAIETSLRLPDDSLNAGKRLRTVVITALVDIGDGNGPQFQTLHMQVLKIADENGNAVQWTEHTELELAMLDELRAIRFGMQRLLDDGSVGKGGVPDFDLIEIARSMRDDTANI